MAKGNYKPIPREEPADEDSFLEAPVQLSGPATVRPPAGPASSSDGGGPACADYQSLRASCRAGDAVLDDELAVEAEILRLAMDRGRGKSGARG